MWEVVILEKVYGDRSGFEKLNKKFCLFFGEFDVEWKFLVVKKNWVKVIFLGEDEEVSVNFVREEFGEVFYSLKNVEEG